MIEGVVRTNYLGTVWAVRAFLPGSRRPHPLHVVNDRLSGRTGRVPALRALLRREARAARLLARCRGGAPGPGRPGAHDQPRLRRDRRLPAEGLPRDAGARTAGRAAGDGSPSTSSTCSRRNRRETVVPRWYRIALLAQALVPGLVHRAVSRARYRKPRSGLARMNSSARRSCLGVFTVSHKPSCRKAWSRPSAASSGNVVVRGRLVPAGGRSPRRRARRRRS